MNLEQRILKLEKSNKYYKIALSICICLFFISAKDVLVKDEIHVKKIVVDEVKAKNIVSDKILLKSAYSDKDIKNSNTVSIEPTGLKIEYSEFPGYDNSNIDRYVRIDSYGMAVNFLGNKDYKNQRQVSYGCTDIMFLKGNETIKFIE